MLVRTVATPVCLMSWELDSTFITNRTVKCLSWCVIFLIVNRALASRRPQRATVGLLVSQFFPLCWCFFITCWLGIIWLKLSSYSLHTKKCTVHVCFSKWGLGGGGPWGAFRVSQHKGKFIYFHHISVHEERSVHFPLNKNISETCQFYVFDYIEKTCNGEPEW